MKMLVLTRIWLQLSSLQIKHSLKQKKFKHEFNYNEIQSQSLYWFQLCCLRLVDELLPKLFN